MNPHRETLKELTQERGRRVAHNGGRCCRHDACDDGVVMKPLSLSDPQLKAVQTAAALLPPGARDSFPRSIAGRLVDIATPSDDDIAAAVNFVLSTRGISTPAYLCDGA
jgi:hypothetical protein